MAEERTDPKPYTPSETDQKLIALVTECYDQWRPLREPHESQWYLNSAFIRGQQYVEWDTPTASYVEPPAPSYRVRRVFNLILPKIMARKAKFLKNRPVPIVKPATQDVKDILDARMTTKALAFLWRKVKLEEKYQYALDWTAQAGRGYWWISWDPEEIVRVQTSAANTEMGTDAVIEDAKLGDISVEVGSPLELLVEDPTIGILGKQPRIMRVKLREVEWVKARYEDKADYVKAEADDERSAYFEKAIGALTNTGLSGQQISGAPKRHQEPEPRFCVVKELFVAPTGDFPKGRYLVVANGVLLKAQDELPYEMYDQENPYPVVEFPEMALAGMYWIPTICEQLIPPQKQYNTLRSKIEEQLKAMAFPKIIVAKQHRVADGAWTAAPGEMIEYVAHPNIPPPTTWSPPNIATDTWRTLELLKGEIDTISQIYPESEGRVGQSTSGFQTNLLQEATDSVHAPVIRTHERAVEEAGLKFRHLMKLMYDVKRLITITTRDDQTEAFEFSSDNIDENADIVVEAGSGLPSLKGARIQMALELRNAGVFGNPQDPEVNRKVMTLLDMGDLSTVYADARRDEERGRLENLSLERGQTIEAPLFCDNHDIHYRVHTDQLKSADTKLWPMEQQKGLIEHIIAHAVFVNPTAAQQIAAIYGLPVPQLPQPAAPPAPPGGMSPPGAPPNQGPPPPAGPPPPPTGAPASGNTQMDPTSGFGASGTNATLTA